MKGLTKSECRVFIALVGLATLAACDPTCNCEGTIDCFGDVDDVVRECDLGASCQTDSKGRTGLCVEVFEETME